MNCKNSILAISTIIILLGITVTSCYSFKGISIAPDVNTYYISTFENRAGNAPAGIEQQFSETLKDKVRNESRLKYSDENPDIEFEGSITGFNVRSMAPTSGNLTAFNRLTISVSVNYINANDEEENWTKSFSWYQDFENDVDLSSSQDEFVETIFVQLAEDVFNAAFTNW